MIIISGKHGSNRGTKEAFNCSFAAHYHRDATEYFTTTKDDDDHYGFTFHVSLKYYMMYFFLGAGTDTGWTDTGFPVGGGANQTAGGGRVRCEHKN